MKKIVFCLVAAILALTMASCGPKAPTWQEQYDLGVRYLSEGNYEEAILAFASAIEIDPKQAPAYVGRGDAYAAIGDFDDKLALAQSDYEMAISLDETNVSAYLGLAGVYEILGDYDSALAVLRNALDVLGENQDIQNRLSEIEKQMQENASVFTYELRTIPEISGDPQYDISQNGVPEGYELCGFGLFDADTGNLLSQFCLPIASESKEWIYSDELLEFSILDVRDNTVLMDIASELNCRDTHIDHDLMDIYFDEPGGYALTYHDGQLYMLEKHDRLCHFEFAGDTIVGCSLTVNMLQEPETVALWELSGQPREVLVEKKFGAACSVEGGYIYYCFTNSYPGNNDMDYEVWRYNLATASKEKLADVRAGFVNKIGDGYLEHLSIPMILSGSPSDYETIYF